MLRPDNQPAVQRAGRSLETPRETSRDSLPDGAHPMTQFLRSVSDADRKRGHADTSQGRPWARYDGRGERGQAGGRGRILDNPTHGAAECTPIREGPQANVRRRDPPPREITRHLPHPCHHSLGVPGETPFVTVTPTPTPTPDDSLLKNNVQQWDK